MASGAGAASRTCTSLPAIWRCAGSIPSSSRCRSRRSWMRCLGRRIGASWSRGFRVGMLGVNGMWNPISSVRGLLASLLGSMGFWKACSLLGSRASHSFRSESYGGQPRRRAATTVCILADFARAQPPRLLAAQRRQQDQQSYTAASGNKQVKSRKRTPEARTSKPSSPLQRAGTTKQGHKPTSPPLEKGNVGIHLLQKRRNKQK